ncbi:MAG: hypothetical protein QUS12_13375 [Methanosarcina sp.]|nr:hypothetical protein [Methanosarcina sp.]
MEPEGKGMRLGFGKIKDAIKGGADKNTEYMKKEQIEKETEPDIEKEVTVKTNISEYKSEDGLEYQPEKNPLIPASRAEARKTGLIFFPAFDWAISPTHPEREERLLYTGPDI